MAALKIKLTDQEQKLVNDFNLSEEHDLYVGKPEVMQRFNGSKDPKYLYRAMNYDEAYAWLSRKIPENAYKEGCPCSTYFNYSKTYMTKSGYKCMLQVHVPDLISEFEKIGFQSGKAESRAEGDLSISVGRQSNSNSFRADKQINKNLAKAKSELNEQEKAEAKNLKDRFLFNYLCTKIFLQSIKEVKIVAIRPESKC